MLGDRCIFSPMSDLKQKFIKSFLAAQKQMRGAEKDARNPHFKNQYSTLESVIDAVKEPLNSNGIAFSHRHITVNDGVMSIQLYLMHEEGHEESSIYQCQLKDASPQGVAGAVTYSKRYSLMAYCGIPSADDDGETASGRPTSLGVGSSDSSQPSQFKLYSKAVSEATTEERLSELTGKLTASRLSPTEKELVTKQIAEAKSKLKGKK